MTISKYIMLNLIGDEFRYYICNQFRRDLPNLKSPRSIRIGKRFQDQIVSFSDDTWTIARLQLLKQIRCTFSVRNWKLKLQQTLIIENFMQCN